VKSSIASLLALLASAVMLPACGGGSGSTAPVEPAAGRSRVAAPSDPPATGFRDSSGVTDIPAFGSEAAAQRPAVTRALTAYLQAADSGEWGRACDRLAASTAVELRRLTLKLKQVTHKSCEEGLRLSLGSPSSGTSLYYGPADVAAVRIKRGNGAGEGGGFALFHGNDGGDYWMTVRLEGGEWKVSSPAAQPLR
jgi:hypothetical protein